MRGLALRRLALSSAVLAGMGLGIAHSASARVDDHHEAAEQVVKEALFRIFSPLAVVPERVWEVEQSRVPVTYTVRPGDTLSQIADRFGVSLHELMAANGLRHPHAIRAGKTLKVPMRKELYVVGVGETLDRIAEKKGVAVDDLLRNNPELRVRDGQVYAGQVLVLPRDMPIGVPKRKSVVRVASAVSTVSSAEAEAASDEPARATRTKPVRYVNGMPLMWPVHGNRVITSRFGMRWGRLHEGIDIWHPDEWRTPIRAARDGVVTEAGVSRGGYGRLVVIDHGRGVETVYAHLRRIAVSAGQRVEAGEIIGYMGQSGRTTGVHLHFEVRLYGRPVDPMTY
ncbi:MAG: M23 family metallopeptidase, partial [Calditerricola sp.]|nr:M23 family metallopeptidase [Calditerricola sp.]